MAFHGDGANITNTNGFKSWQIFTSSGTWTRPSGITFVSVYVTGGGGGSCETPGNNLDDAGGGGNAGGTSIKLIDVTSISSVTVTVGAAGTGSSGTSDGGNGGTSSFGSHCSATGGEGAEQNTVAYLKSPGVGSGGDLNFKGAQSGPHGINFHYGPTHYMAPRGGDSFWHPGGYGGNSNHNPETGSYGSGGGGHCDGDGVDGGSGVVIVEEYL